MSDDEELENQFNDFSAFAQGKKVQEFAEKMQKNFAKNILEILAGYELQINRIENPMKVSLKKIEKEKWVTFPLPISSESSVHDVIKSGLDLFRKKYWGYNPREIYFNEHVFEEVLKIYKPYGASRPSDVKAELNETGKLYGCEINIYDSDIIVIRGVKTES